MTPRDRKAKEQEKAAQQAGDQAAQAVADRTGVGEKKSDPEELREDIAQTREELGATVEELSGRADVKGKVQQKAGERKEQLGAKVAEVRERAASATPEDVRGAASQAATAAQERPLPAIVGAFSLGLLIGWTIKRS